MQRTHRLPRRAAFWVVAGVLCFGAAACGGSGDEGAAPGPSAGGGSASAAAEPARTAAGRAGGTPTTAAAQPSVEAQAQRMLENCLRKAGFEKTPTDFEKLSPKQQQAVQQCGMEVLRSLGG